MADEMAVAATGWAGMSRCFVRIFFPSCDRTFSSSAKRGYEISLTIHALSSHELDRRSHPRGHALHEHHGRREGGGRGAERGQLLIRARVRGRA